MSHGGNRKSVNPRTVREARAFLQKRGLHTADIIPSDFAYVAARIQKSFSETLRMIALLQTGGVGGSQFEQTKEAIRGSMVPR